MYEAWLAMGIDCDGMIRIVKTNATIQFSNNVEKFVDTYRERVNALGCVTTNSWYDSRTSRQYTVSVTHPIGGPLLRRWENKLKFLEIILPHLVRKREIALEAIQLLKGNIAKLKEQDFFVLDYMKPDFYYSLQELVDAFGFENTRIYARLRKLEKWGNVRKRIGSDGLAYWTLA